jgi:hypothetical protein
VTAVGGSALPSLGSFSGRERIRYSLDLADPAECPHGGITGRLENADVQHNASMARYWQGVLGIAALAAGSWLAWLTV